MLLNDDDDDGGNTSGGNGGNASNDDCEKERLVVVEIWRCSIGWLMLEAILLGVIKFEEEENASSSLSCIEEDVVLRTPNSDSCPVLAAEFDDELSVVVSEVSSTAFDSSSSSSWLVDIVLCLGDVEVPG